MKIASLENKRIAILGFGVTGQEVYKVLQKNYNITIVNENPVQGFSVISAKQAISEEIEFDVIIKSPGVPYSNLLLQTSSATVVNDIELCYQVINEYKLTTKIIAITGTNGKTTTTQFITDVLNKSGHLAIACGNIGQSPLFALNNHLSVDYLVMELSSYQLKQVSAFTPDYGLFLNISPDHIDYHGSFEDYMASKCNLFRNMKEGSTLVLDSQLVVSYPSIEWPIFASYGASEAVLKNVSTLAMPKQNYRLIMGLLIAVGIAPEFIVKSLNEFKGLPHRMEVVETKHRFKVINDSKATNVNATNVAISNLAQNATLIVGGSIKVEDYTLLNYQNKFVKRVIAYGQARTKFGFIPNLISFEIFADAVRYGLNHTDENEVLLLSPACASYGQHKNYIERGDEFKLITKGENE